MLEGYAIAVVIWDWLGLGVHRGDLTPLFFVYILSP
nr:MAG TPA: hypothetical protein [Caudoviricetes sp.]